MESWLQDSDFEPADSNDDNEIEDMLFADYIEVHATSPEKRLLLAVLERAVLDLCDNSESDFAFEWFKSNLLGKGETITFLDVCNACDLNPSNIRVFVCNLYERYKNRYSNPGSSVANGSNFIKSLRKEQPKAF